MLLLVGGDGEEIDRIASGPAPEAPYGTRDKIDRRRHVVTGRRQDQLRRGRLVGKPSFRLAPFASKFPPQRIDRVHLGGTHLVCGERLQKTPLVEVPCPLLTAFESNESIEALHVYE